MKTRKLLLIILGGVLISSSPVQDISGEKNQARERNIQINFNEVRGDLNPMFNECIGTGRANERLRANWQHQLSYVKKRVDSGISSCTGC